jgi:hypothetical protein
MAALNVVTIQSRPKWATTGSEAIRGRLVRFNAIDTLTRTPAPRRLNREEAEFQKSSNAFTRSRYVWSY